MEKQIAVALALLLCGPFFAFAEEGTATLFPSIGVISGPCNGKRRFQGTEPLYVAKAGAALWADGAACGLEYCVVCVGAADPSRSSPCSAKAYVAVTIEAPCPDCGHATMSISKPGFEALADPNAANTIKIEYSRIDNAVLPCA